LGIYGKYGVYFSSYWGDANGYVSSAYKLFRNFDGNKSTYGDTNIDATNPDIENLSVYASTEGNGGKTHVILINKKDTPVTVRVNLANITATNGAVYGFDASSTNVRKFGDVTVSQGGFTYTLPATSAVHVSLSGTTLKTPTPLKTTTITPKK
ncbi:MAG: PKD domain-containing protein, partial [Patescibacteria group bacterium]